MTSLNIAYLTNRKNPRIEWFFDSLHRECGGCYSDIRLIVVDYYNQVTDQWSQDDVDSRRNEFSSKAHHEFIHTAPKPTVWQGPHRLTSKNYFAAANARNTALCYADDGYLVTVDDLSILTKGWLVEVKTAQERGYIACGSYLKAKDLKVERGEIISFMGSDTEIDDEHDYHQSLFLRTAEKNAMGLDMRFPRPWSTDPRRTGGGGAFGCSFGAPVEALLSVNGWDEDNDCMGGEDYCCGLMLEKQGYPLYYFPRMMTLESEDGHWEEEQFTRMIKGPSGVQDASNRMLSWVRNGTRQRGKCYGVESLEELRVRIRRGDRFPAVSGPTHDWRDGESLEEM